MNKFTRSLATEWRRLRLPAAGAKIVVAVSGGADSTALLLALGELCARKKLANEFVVAHFDHNLRTAAEGADDAAFVAGIAARLGFRFVVEHGAVETRGNLEQNSRRARYAFLGRVATEEKASLTLVAHTLGDQAETVLMNLVRGAGPDGLAGMSALAEVEGVAVARPLLSWATRAATNAFCAEAEVVPRGDPMNDDARFTRVRIRRELIPLLETFNPKIVETLARNASAMRARATSDETFDDELPVAALSDLAEDARASLVRRWLGRRRGGLRGLTAAHLAAVASLAVSTKSGRVAQLPGGEAVVKRGGKLVWTRECS